MLRLILERADGSLLSKQPLAKDAHLDIGRSRENDLVLPWDGVSRRHARLEGLIDGVWLEDCDSKNGLLVGRRAKDRLRLEPGLRVQIGAGFLSLEEVGTSDLALMPIEGISSSLNDGLSDAHRQSHSTGCYETAAESALGPSPERALGWLARYGGLPVPEGTGRASWLAVIELLGAQGLAWVQGRCRRGHNGVERIDDPRVERCIGHFPPTISLELGWSASESYAVVARDERPHHWLVAMWADDVEIEPWQRHFFEILGHRNGQDEAPEPAVESDVQAPRPPVLEFPEGMVPGTSDAMTSIYSRIAEWSGSRAPVLLRGPTGVGKELIADFLHRNSAHRHGELVALNCSAFPESLVDSMLFGIGAKVATDVDARPGLIAQAHGGTLFLDEIGDLSISIQVKLLRVLQQRKILPLGSNRPIDLDFQLITATHVDLEAAIEEGDFRRDLYYRIAGWELHIPGLAERRTDIPELVAHFLAEMAGEKRVQGISRRALDLLIEHPWPGHIRELRGAVERALWSVRPGEALESRHLQPILSEKHPSMTNVGGTRDKAIVPGPDTPAETPPRRILREAVEEKEREVLTEALVYFKGNQTRVAEALGLSRFGLRKKLQKLKIDPAGFRGGGS